MFYDKRCPKCNWPASGKEEVVVRNKALQQDHAVTCQKCKCRCKVQLSNVDLIPVAYLKVA